MDKGELFDNAFNKAMEWLGRPFNLSEMTRNRELSVEFNEKIDEYLKKEYEVHGLEYRSKMFRDI